jgi:general secretion pathway protein L
LIAEFMDWWFARLRELVPQRLAARDAWRDAAVVDASDGTSLALHRRREDSEPMQRAHLEDAAALSVFRDAVSSLPRRSPIVVLLPDGRILERQVILPLAAERELRGVLGYELPRLTPFEKDEIFWSFNVRERDVPRKRLVLDLQVAPRDPVIAVLDLVAPVGSRSFRLETRGAGGFRSLDLTPHDDAARAPGSRALAMATWALAAMVVFYPFVEQRLDMAAARTRLDRVSVRMAEVQKLRKEISGAGDDVLATEALRVGDALETLAAVTDDLPDDSHLTELTFRERKLTFSGMSGAAPRLIGTLSSDRRLRNPAFSAPVTRNEAMHLDVFSITAEVSR